VSPLLVVLIAVATLAALLSVAALTWGRGRRFDDVERFHRARAMTTAWSRNGADVPVAPADEREGADA